MKTNLLVLFLIFSCCIHAQDLPWYFNTVSFRNWATQNNVRSLLLSGYETKDQDYYGLSHQTYFPGDKRWNYISKCGYFVRYYLDPNGYVTRAESMRLEVLYGAEHASPKVTQYFEQFLENMASGATLDFKAGEMDCQEMEGSTYCRFGKDEYKSANLDGTTNIKGEKITDRHGVTYRENVLNIYDSTMELYFGYDKQLRRVIEYEKNVAVAGYSYLFVGDCYDPISTKEVFEPATELVSSYTVRGVFDKSISCDGKAKDSVFTLPAYTYRNPGGAHALEPGLIPGGAADLSPVERYGYGLVEPDGKRVPLIENTLVRYRESGTQVSVHSVSWNKSTKPITHADFFSYCRSGLPAVGQQDEHWKETIRTTKTYYRNGILKAIHHDLYITGNKSWLPIGTEKYAKNGALVKVESNSPKNLEMPLEQMERDDAGFVHVLDKLYGEVSVTGKADELKITANKSTILHATKTGVGISSLSMQPGYFFDFKGCEQDCTYWLKVVNP